MLTRISHESESHTSKLYQHAKVSEDMKKLPKLFRRIEYAWHKVYLKLKKVSSLENKHPLNVGNQSN